MVHMTGVGAAGWVSLGALALQFGLHPLLATAFLPRALPKAALVLLAELLKLAIAAAAIASWPAARRSAQLKQWSLVASLQVAALPAALYSVQNVLVQVGYLHVDSVTFSILNQTKTLSAAFWVWLLLGKRQSGMQILALLLLLVSAVILNLPKATTTTTTTDNQAATNGSFAVGVLPILAASMISGLSSALAQWALQNKSRESFVYNFELAAYSLVVLSVHIWWNGEQDAVYSLWYDFHSIAPMGVLAFLPILSQAVGGLLTGFVAKYADTTMKGFALIAGLLITCITQAVTGVATLTSQHFLALVCVSVGIYLHASFPPNPQPQLQTNQTAKLKEQ